MLRSKVGSHMRIAGTLTLAVLGGVLMVPSSLGQLQTTPAQPIGGSSSIPPATAGANRTAGRGAEGGAGLMIVPEDFSKLTLAPGFQLSLQVFDMPEISTQLRVDDSGDVEIPLAGKVHVGGLTLPQAQNAISKLLVDKQILHEPEINLDVLQYAANNVSVIGEVQTPGRIQLLAPHNLPDVLAMVGGETTTAGNRVSIRRMVDGKEQVQTFSYARSGNFDEIRNIMVQPGDTVVVPRAGIVYVLGGVNRPGGYIMQEDGKLDVAQALSMAYGTETNAAVGSIRVVRKRPDGTTETLPISYKKIMNGKEQPLVLQAEDIVYVPISKLKSIATAGLATSTSSAAIYATH